VTRAKAIVRAQALYRLSKDKAATVAEAELATEHLARLRERFDLLPHEIDPRKTPPPPPVSAPVPFGVEGGWMIVNGMPVPVSAVRVTFVGTTATGSTSNFRF